MNDFQKWCKEILPIVQAAADGVEIEYLDIDDDWTKKTECNLRGNTEYRIKPKTIKVNGFDVPEPMREVNKGMPYFVPSITHDSLFIGYSFTGHKFDSMCINRGICHTTKEAAIIHAKAMLGIDPYKD